MAPFQFVFILPTNACPVRCEHCFYEVGHLSRLPEADFLEPLAPALDALTRAGLQQIMISGGEPLAYRRLDALLRLCADQLVHVLLLTHGELLDEAMLERLERAGVDDLTISAPRPTDALRRTVQRAVFHSRFYPTLLTSLTRQSAPELPALLELAERFELPQIVTPAYIPQDAPQAEALSLRRMDEAEWAALEPHLLRWAERAGLLRSYLGFVRAFYRGKPRHPGACAMGTAGFVIEADGSVYPCFHRRDLCAGNLRHEPWHQIQPRLEALGASLQTAPCFGEHCLSLFVGAV